MLFFFLNFVLFLNISLLLVFIFFLPLTSPIVCFLSGPGLQGLQSKHTSSFTAVCSSAKWGEHTAIPKPGKRYLSSMSKTQNKTRKLS